MSLRKLPTINAFERPDHYQWDAPSSALELWAAAPRAAGEDAPGVVSIFDVIGYDSWTGGGFTAKRMAGALRAIGEKPVTVEVNSPGGDMFEGLAIFNILKDHKAEVTVKIMGLAASAASVVAMAGDSIQMGQGSFLMIHNAWGAVIGNQHDMRAAADTFAPFDAAMADIYASRSGQKVDDVAKMMDAETFINAKDAIEMGFADATFDDSYRKKDEDMSARAETGARRRLDALLAKQGVPRSERRKMFRDAGMHNAAEPATPNAGLDMGAALRLLQTLTNKEP